MECLCGHAAGSHEDRTSVDTPVVISCFVSELELEGFGRIATLSWVGKQTFLFLFMTQSFFSCRWRCRKLWHSKQRSGRHTRPSKPPRPKCVLTTKLGDELPGGGHLPAGKYPLLECGMHVKPSGVVARSLTGFYCSFSAASWNAVCFLWVRFASCDRSNWRRERMFSCI